MEHHFFTSEGEVVLTQRVHLAPTMIQFAMLVIHTKYMAVIRELIN